MMISDYSVHSLCLPWNCNVPIQKGKGLQEPEEPGRRAKKSMTKAERDAAEKIESFVDILY